MKNIIIIGSEGLIGTALIKGLCKYYNILAIDKRKKFKKFKKFLSCDLSTMSGVKILKNYLMLSKKRYFAVINLAYPAVRGKKKNFFTIDPFEISEEISEHFGVYFSTMQTLVNYFINKKIKGNIINFTSIYGEFIPRFEIYDKTSMNMPIQYLITKNNIINTSKYVAKINLKKNIRVNCISPGGIIDNQNKNFVKKYSRFTQTNSLLKAKNLIGLVEFILSNKSSNITGQNLIIDDGFTL